jgi:hypothetical protein
MVGMLTSKFGLITTLAAGSWLALGYLAFGVYTELA